MSEQPQAILWSVRRFGETAVKYVVAPTAAEAAQDCVEQYGWEVDRVERVTHLWMVLDKRNMLGGLAPTLGD